MRLSSKRAQTLRKQVAERPRLVVLPVVGVAIVVLLALLPGAGRLRVVAGAARRLRADPEDLGDAVVRLRAARVCPTARRRPGRIPVEAHTWVSLAAAASRRAADRRSTRRGRHSPHWLPSRSSPGSRARRRCCATCATAGGCVSALEAYAPTIAMGFAGRSGGPWQLRMWEPYLLRSGERCVVITLHEKYLPLILDGADLTSPLVQLGSRGTRDLDSLFVPSIRAVFYVQNAQANKGFMDHTELHPRVAQPRRLRQAGQLQSAPRALRRAGRVRPGRDRPLRAARHPRRPGEVQILGRPQASGVLPARGPIAELRAQARALRADLAGRSTSRSTSRRSRRGRDRPRADRRATSTVIFRPHPLSYRWRRPPRRDPGDPRHPAGRPRARPAAATGAARRSTRCGASSTAPTTSDALDLGRVERRLGLPAVREAVRHDEHARRRRGRSARSSRSPRPATSCSATCPTSTRCSTTCSVRDPLADGACASASATCSATSSATESAEAFAGVRARVSSEVRRARRRRDWKTCTHARPHRLRPRRLRAQDPPDRLADTTTATSPSTTAPHDLRRGGRLPAVLHRRCRRPRLPSRARWAS